MWIRGGFVPPSFDKMNYQFDDYLERALISIGDGANAKGDNHNQYARFGIAKNTLEQQLDAFGLAIITTNPIY
jgi:hypothetical protein